MIDSGYGHLFKRLCGTSQEDGDCAGGDCTSGDAAGGEVGGGDATEGDCRLGPRHDEYCSPGTGRHESVDSQQVVGPE